MAKKYLLGLDLGTNSVGWCVTDENDKIIRKNGKSLWGSRLFEDASDASARRMNRSARRRLGRRKQRMNLLRAFFKPEIDKVDPTFFFRLDESYLQKEDKHPSIAKLPCLLFNEPGFTDKEFFAKYPTIYHLRKELTESDKKADIRLIYLAFAHMIKYRGNFLNQGQNIGAFDAAEATDIVNELDQEIYEKELIHLCPQKDWVEQLKLLIPTSHGISGKKEILLNLFPTENSYLKTVVFPLASGSEIAVKKVFPDIDDDSDLNPKKISCASETFDEDLAKLSELFPGSAIEIRIIGTAKRLYDYLLLGKLLGDSKTISEAMVARYNEHKKQLRVFKKYIKEKDKQTGGNLYEMMFGPKTVVVEDKDGKQKTVTLNNYSAYVGTYFDKKAFVNCSHCKQSDFYKFVKEALNIPAPNKESDEKSDKIDSYCKEIRQLMADNSFLPRQNSSENGVFPYQLNLQELQAIISRQAPFYPFLSGDDKDSEGYSTVAKIKSLLTFRIPYYVGPVIVKKEGSENHPFAWTFIDPAKGSIKPWNFDSKINKEESAEKFIQRMLNHCTYFPDEPCLAKNSLLFQEYEVLSFLNKIRVNKELLTPEKKAELIDGVFKKRAKVSLKDLKAFYKPNDVEITMGEYGKEITDIPSMSSYVFFSKDNVLGKEFVDSKEGNEIVEDIIRDLTVFEDKEIVEARLKKLYDLHKLPKRADGKEKQVINAIENQRMSGWGRLSKKLLLLKTIRANEFGEVTIKTLIQMIRETNKNLMELIEDDGLDFKKQIEDEQHASAKDFSNPSEKHQAILEFVEDSYVSPGMKRPLIQAMDIIQDVEKIVGHPIDEYYIECTRTNKAEKKKKDSRKTLLDKLFGAAKEAARNDIKEALEHSKNQLKTIEEGKLRGDKYFLYFSQLGKDIYTGEEIDLNNLDQYDIDHIVPQALVKDDSISNRVLTLSSHNRDKGANYPIPDSIFNSRGVTNGRAKAKELYKYLKNNGLMSEKKYAALTRETPLTKDEMKGFVERQLVYTNQAVKALVDLINRFQKNRNGEAPTVVYSKAENVSNFRHEHNILKSRDVNHCHHAHDAYLNICVGRAINTYYQKYIWLELQKKDTNEITNDINKQKGSLNLENVFKEYRDKDGIACRKPLLDKDGGVVWDYNASVQTIKNNIYKRVDVLITRMQCLKGNFFEKTQTKPKGEGSVPVKEVLHEVVDGKEITRESPLTDCSRYGGIPSLSYGFYSLVEMVSKKGKKEVSATIVVPVPNLYCRPGDKEALGRYLTKKRGLNVRRIIIPCLRPNFVVVKDQSRVVVSGVDTAMKSYHIKPDFSIKYSESEISTVRKIRKLMDLVSKKPKEVEEEQFINQTFISKEDSLILSPAGSPSAKEVVLTNEELVSLYLKFGKIPSYLLTLLPGFSSVIDFLKTEKSKEIFTALSIYKKSNLLIGLVEYFNASSARVDLSLIHGGKNAGKLAISSVLPKGSCILAESPTGYYTKVLWKSE